MPTVRLAALSILTMMAFAANSVLSRLALAESEIGAGSFVLLRLLSGALILVLWVRKREQVWRGNWAGAISLLLYAVFFTYAYLALPAGTGAVILFAVVQFTMLGWGFYQGERLALRQIAGLALSAGCLIWLLSPGLGAPTPLAAAAMALAGVGWGAYSLLGRGVSNPTATTCGNFLRASLIGLLLLGPILWLQPEPMPSLKGVSLALVSGALTSGLGYALWYQVVKHLRATQAGMAQLSVPAFAALGGVVFLSEPLTLRFSLATLGILSGVALAVLTRAQTSTKAEA